MRVEGTIQVAEGNAYAGKVRARIVGPNQWLAGIGMAVGLLAFAVSLAWLISLTGLPWSVGMLIALVPGWYGAIRVCRWHAVRSARRQLGDRGLQGQLFNAFELDDQGITVSMDGSHQFFAWRVVSDVVRSGPYWAVIGNGGTAWLPRRFFADVVEEKAFIGEIMRRIGEPARARSPEAAAFLATAA